MRVHADRVRRRAQGKVGTSGCYSARGKTSQSIVNEARSVGMTESVEVRFTKVLRRD